MISFDGVGYHDIMRGVKGAEERFYQCGSSAKQRLQGHLQHVLYQGQHSIHMGYDRDAFGKRRGIADRISAC